MVWETTHLKTLSKRKTFRLTLNVESLHPGICAVWQLKDDVWCISQQNCDNWRDLCVQFERMLFLSTRLWLLYSANLPWFNCEKKDRSNQGQIKKTNFTEMDGQRVQPRSCIQFSILIKFKKLRLQFLHWPLGYGIKSESVSTDLHVQMSNFTAELRDFYSLVTQQFWSSWIDYTSKRSFQKKKKSSSFTWPFKKLWGNFQVLCILLNLLAFNWAFIYAFWLHVDKETNTRTHQLEIKKKKKAFIVIASNSYNQTWSTAPCTAFTKINKSINQSIK